MQPGERARPKASTRMLGAFALSLIFALPRGPRESGSLGESSGMFAFEIGGWRVTGHAHAHALAGTCTL